VLEIVRFLLDASFLPLETVKFFQEIDRRWPGLSFADFVTATRLAEAIALRPRDSAPHRRTEIAAERHQAQIVAQWLTDNYPSSRLKLLEAFTFVSHQFPEAARVGDRAK
jgi:hypothetical protein